LNSGPPNKNPYGSREEDLKPAPWIYKSSALTARPSTSISCLPQIANNTNFKLFAPKVIKAT